MFVPPKVFISYSWDSGEHKDWVKDLATRLRKDSIDVTLDQWDLVPGDQLPQFMERAIRDSSFVLIVCTPNFRLKSDDRKGGVGYEGDVMTGEVFTNKNNKKFIPVLRSGNWDTASPSWLRGKYYINLSGSPYSENQYQDLLAVLHGTWRVAPPLGPKPPAVTTDAIQPQATNQYGALATLTILLDEIHELVSLAEAYNITFGESRRILYAISRLHRFIEGAVLKIEKSVPDSLIKEIRNFADVIGQYAMEADITLPGANDEKYPRSRDRLKALKDNVFVKWGSLKPAILEDPLVAVDFNEKKVEDQLVWNKLGYKDRRSFWRFISPHVKDRIERAEETELTLFEEIIEKGAFPRSDMLSEGYPRGIVVEVINSLIRDEYINIKNPDACVLTQVGKRVISKILEEKLLVKQPNSDLANKTN